MTSGKRDNERLACRAVVVSDSESANQLLRCVFVFNLLRSAHIAAAAVVSKAHCISTPGSYQAPRAAPNRRGLARRLVSRYSSFEAVTTKTDRLAKQNAGRGGARTYATLCVE